MSEQPLILSETDETLMRSNLLKCYGTSTKAFRVSVEHYRYIAEQVVLLRVHIKQIATITAERDALRNALNWIAHTFTEDSHGNMKTLPASDYQMRAIAALKEPKP